MTDLFGDLTDPDRILAVDDSGNALRVADVRASARRWSDRIGERKCLSILLCDNTSEHLREYMALVIAGQAVVLVGAGIADAALQDLVDRFRPRYVVRAGDAAVEFDAPADIHPDLAVLLSTSGSTGSPKLVRFSKAQLEANAVAIVDYLGIDQAERPMAHLPFNYSFGLSVIHSHLSAGAVVLLSRHSLMSSDFWNRLAGEEATSLSGVPFHFEMLLKLRFQRRDLPHLKVLAQAGGKLAPELAQRIAEIADETGRRFFIMYGQTEAGPRISYLPPEKVGRKPNSIGRAIPGVALTLASAPDLPVGVGELVVESRSIMMGYAEIADDLARGDDCGGRLSTGDLASVDGDGDFLIVGRTSRFIKLQGNRVNLADVEARLAAMGLAVACVGIDDHLWIATDTDDPETIRAAVLDQFTFPARSTECVRIARLPRSDGGKVLYRELLEALRAEG